MPASRIFVSYALSGDERGAEVARQLIGDLRTSNTEVVADGENISDEQYMTFLSRELPKCHYLIFVQTPVSLKSLRVQTAVNMALTMVAQHRMQGVLRLLAAPPEGMDDQPSWITPRTFDASSDYARARDKLFLELELIHLDANDSLLARFPAGAVQPPASGSGSLSVQQSGSVSAPPVPASGNLAPPSVYSGPVPTVRPGGPAPTYNAALAQSSGPVAAARPAGSYGPPPPLPNPTMQPTPYGGVLAPNPPQATPYAAPQVSTPQVTPFGGISAAGTPQSTPLGGPNVPQVTPFGPPMAASSFSSRPEDDRPVPLKSKTWLKMPALFSRPFKTYQTRLAAQPHKPAMDEMETLLEDRPLPLDTPRKKIIRWTLVGVIVLALVLGTTLTVLQIRNHQITKIPSTPVHGQQTTLPATSTPGLPTPSSTQGGITIPDPQSTIDVYAGGQLALNDDLTADNGTSHWHLATGTPSCQFVNKTYVITSTGVNYCLADNSNFSNFDYQVQIKIVQGTAAGVVFRANDAKHTYYYFMITTDGHFALWRNDATSKTPILVPKTSAFASAIHTGIDQANLIAVSANGKQIICYVNKTPVIKIREGTYTTGSIGTMVGMPKEQGQTEAAYQFARVWMLG